jgi:transposase InsO family protein
MKIHERRDVVRKLKVLEHAKTSRNVSFTCRHFGISRETFYQWRRIYMERGEKGLVNSKPCPANPRLRLPAHVEEKILYLRRTYHFGSQRISWYIERHHGMKASNSGVYNVLKRNGLNRLPEGRKKRVSPFVRYEKQVPGHHVQVDVKFLTFQTPEGKKVRRFQYTAIDDATRIRAIKIYERHTQKNAIDFIDYVVEKFPFRIHTVRTDNGHEFQIQFHWHLGDIGISHAYIKPRTPRLNGKVERSHRTDQREFYQLLTYRGDVDLQEKLTEWVNFYNYFRPHAALGGQTPYERLIERMDNEKNKGKHYVSQG